jgi:GAF domain-containing protein
METNFSGIAERFMQPMEELQVLRQFSGAAKEFWPRLLAAAGQLTLAHHAVLLLAKPNQSPRWAKVGEWNANPGPSRVSEDFTEALLSSADRAALEGTFIEEDDVTSGAYTLGARLRLLRVTDEAVIVLQLLDFTESAAREAQVRIGLALDTPALYQAHLASQKAQADVEKFAVVMDLMVAVNQEERFLAATLALVNGVASRFHADRASIGWKKGGYLRLQSMSRTEKFDRQMAAAQLLESAMEECADQDEEIVWPRPDGSSAVTKDHEKFAREQQLTNFCTIPIRSGDEVVAVVALERLAPSFSELELQQLRLLCDQAAPRLVSLQASDRWFGARWAADWKRMLSRAVGPEHTWMKALALALALLLIVLFAVRVPYRVEGTFILRAQEAAYLTAPFDGFVQKVSVRPGDKLQPGQEIMALNRSELLLDQSAASAEMARYEREAEKARATRSLAEMRINEALYVQTKAKLDLVNYRLSNAVLKAPFEGVVVEGDLRERISSPVKQGEALYKLAKLDGLYVEAEIPERDIKPILQSNRAEIAFVTQPHLTFKATVETIEPAAVPKKENNVFLVRLRLNEPPQSWFRPGMTGLCKVEASRQTLWYILTHRTVDFLRLKLWW